MSQYEKRKERNRSRRRASIEPVIGHLKTDNRLSRNFLKGIAGDQINVMLVAAAFNLRKWMRKVEKQTETFFALFYKTVEQLVFSLWGFMITSPRLKSTF